MSIQTQQRYARAQHVKRYPLIATDDPCDPFLATVYRYLAGDGDPVDIDAYLQRAERGHFLPYHGIR